MTRVTNYTFEDISIGTSAEHQQHIREEDIRMFAALSGDNNPVHLDHKYAQKTPFGGVVAHGMYCGALVSRVLGTQLPGPGTIYLSQSLSFRAPVFPGDDLTVRIEVVALHERKPIVTLKCVITNQSGKVVTEGQSVVVAPTTKESIDMPALPVFKEKLEA